MANEITVNATLQGAKVFTAESLSLGSTQFNMAGSNYQKATQSIPTTAGGTAIKLGNLGSIGWFFIKNLDTTNYVQIMNAVSGTVMLRILPGGFACGYFDSVVVAPAALANTAAVVIDYLMFEV